LQAVVDHEDMGGVTNNGKNLSVSIIAHYTAGTAGKGDTTAWRGEGR
jgi:hypothetical protein